VPNAADNCPSESNQSQADGDGDGRGTLCDTDGESTSTTTTVTNNTSTTETTSTTGTTPTTTSTEAAQTRAPGKCAALSGKKRSACVRKRCGKLKRAGRKQAYRACVRRVTRKA
jgi:hypothetical protein